MKVTDNTKRLVIAACGLIPCGICWTVAAWLGRDPAPVHAAWTNSVFAGAIVCTYFGAWSLAFALSRDPRRTAFRALSATFGILAAVLLLEAPVTVDLINYKAMREALTYAKSLEVSFIQDRQLLFRRARHVHWQGIRRPDIADYFNLPMQANRLLTFTTDQDGFRN